MAKFSYRGKELAELKTMSNDEFAKLLTARQRRSLKRGQTKKDPKLFKKINKAIKEVESEKPQKNVKTHRRNIVITPKMVGLTIHVHNGNEFKKTVITEKMIGHFIGEYAVTKKLVKHSSPGVGASKSSKFVSVK